MKRMLVTYLLVCAAWAQPGPKTILQETPNFVAARAGRYLVVELRSPHRVLSTSAGTGGQLDTIRYLVNHQSMEPAADNDRHDKIVSLTEEQYHDLVSEELGLPPAEVAAMGTAANMHYIGHRHLEFRDLMVDAFVTAGVEGNAMRPGDPGNWYEGENGMEYIRPEKGTINTILIINQPLTAAAQARAVTTLTEAKTAALMELAVPSRYSTHLATGTSTDQYIVAAPIEASRRILKWTGPDTKLGEMIGQAVREATEEALRWQNGLEPSYTRSIPRVLGRFGLTEVELFARLKEILPEKSYKLLVANQMGVMMEPRLAAAAFSYAAVLDRLQYGTLPEDLAGELLRDQAATVAAALSMKPAKWEEFWKQIPFRAEDRVQPFVRGLALGWLARWQ